MTDLGQWTCPKCGKKLSGQRVADPGLPLLVSAHCLEHKAQEYQTNANELRVMAYDSRRRAGFTEDECKTV